MGTRHPTLHATEMVLIWRHSDLSPVRRRLVLRAGGKMLSQSWLLPGRTFQKPPERLHSLLGFSGVIGGDWLTHFSGVTVWKPCFLSGVHSATRTRYSSDKPAQPRLQEATAPSEKAEGTRRSPR